MALTSKLELLFQKRELSFRLSRKRRFATCILKEGYIMELRDSLKYLRRELNMTQKELAKALNLSPLTVTRWETGKALPQTKTIDAILELANRRGASERCRSWLCETLRKGHHEVLQVSDSNLYPVDRESICRLVDDSHTAIFVSDLETDELLYMNHKAEEYIGKPFKADSHGKCYEYLKDRSTPCRQCPKELMLADQSSDFHYVSPINGQKYHFRGRRLIWNGRPAHAQYFFEEATALEESDGANRLMNDLDQGICVFWAAEDGRVLVNYVNDGYFAVMGTTRKARARNGFGMLDGIRPEDSERVLAVIKDAVKAQKSFRMRYHVLADDDSVKELYLRARLVRCALGRGLYYATILNVDELFDQGTGGKGTV